MSDSYLLGVTIETPEGKFVDNGILKVGKVDSKLVIPKAKGIAIAGLLLLALWAGFVFVFASPFVLFHVAPITTWDLLSAALYALAVPVGFVAIAFFWSGLGLRIRIRFPKSERNVQVIDSALGGYRVLHLVVQIDTERLVLVAAGFGRNASKALAYLQPESGHRT